MRYLYGEDGTINGRGMGDSGIRPVTTDENGNFVIEGLLTGAYQLGASHEKFGTGGVDEIPAGTKDIIIKLDPNGPPPATLRRGRGGGEQ